MRPNGPIKIQWRSRDDRREIHKLFVGLDELEVLRIVDEEGEGVYRGRTTEIWGCGAKHWHRDIMTQKKVMRSREFAGSRFGKGINGTIGN